MWGDCDGVRVFERPYGEGRIFWNVPVADILSMRKVPPDFSVSGRGVAVELDVIHRRDGERDLYFVRNKREDWAEVDCVFRPRIERAELWDPLSGARRVLPLSRGDHGRAAATLALPPHGSAFVVFGPSTRPAIGPLTCGGQRIAASAAFEQIASGEITISAPDRLQLLSFKAGAYRLRVGEREREFVVRDIPPAVEIPGPWEVQFASGMGAPPSKSMPRLIS
jgi:hypothetical protein